MKENKRNARTYLNIPHLKLNFRHFAKSIGESISGAEQDYTSIGLGRAVFMLSLPMVLEMIMESIFAVADIFFVSRIGAEAVATVGITESLLTLIYAISFGLSVAASATVSRRIGEKNKEAASDAAFQSILVSLVPATVVSLAGLLFAPEILRLMGAGEYIASEYAGYTRIMLGSNYVIMLIFVINAIFRGAGDAAVSMRVLWFANILNIALDPLLIFGWGPVPAFGIEGAAIATTIGRGAGVVFQLFILIRGGSRIRLLVNRLRADFGVMRRIVKLSFGAIGQNLIATMSWVVLVRIVAEFGSEAVAGYTICVRIIMFAMLPSWGITNAAATLVGQNLGAKRPDRAEQSVWVVAKTNIIVMGLTGLALFLGAERWMGMFIDDPAVVAPGALALKIISIGFISYGLGLVMVNSINGAGDTVTPTRINFLCFWLIEIPLAYVLAITLDLKIEGVALSVLIAETILAILTVAIFKKGKWKLSQV
jgi:putative MATE family efflux protein